MSIVLDELLNNTISYGYGDEEEHVIEISVEVLGDRLIITLVDDGIPFNPFKYGPPNTKGAIDKRNIGGLGIHIVSSLLEKVGYERIGNKNIVILTKLISLGSE
jgi:anti-sigma regulatory factor (Ser/Thr protein kinase)